MSLLLARDGHPVVVAAFLLAKQTSRSQATTSVFDAVDGAHSAASKCHRVVAFGPKRTLDANRRLVQFSNKATVPKPPSAQILTIARAPFGLAASSFTA